MLDCLTICNTCKCLSPSLSCTRVLWYVYKKFIIYGNILVIFISGNGVEKPMTDNLKVKASKAVDDARVAAHAVYDDATVAAHNTLKDAGVEAQNLSDEVKIGVHKVVADAKIAAHEAGSTLKKK
jgi:hypothetical protein